MLRKIANLNGETTAVQEEFRALHGETTELHRKNNRRWLESDRYFQQLRAILDRRSLENKKILKRIDAVTQRQGELDNGLGDFAEGMMRPAVGCRR